MFAELGELVAQIAHPRRTNANKHLNKFRTTETEKWHFALAGDCFG